MNRMMDPVSSLADTLQGGKALLPTALMLRLGDSLLRVRSNEPAMLERLRDYFGPGVATHETGERKTADAIDIEVIDGPAPELNIDFCDWAREPGKQGRKDSYHDLPGARLIRKVRTGMVFLQSANRRMAAGPCLANDNQVINFLLAQTMNHLQQQGWQVCHAAALVGAGRAVALAGFSGGGKSTTMLQAMEDPGTRFLTNDRLFLKRRDGVVQAAGVAKQPRINPGTALHNPRLRGLIDARRRAELEALPGDVLWELEEKHDVPMAELYGAQRVVTQAPLGALVILAWRRDDPRPVSMTPVDLRERRDLLAALMKSPGPFYQHPDGRFQTDREPLDEAAYLALLDHTPVYEVSGGVDFAGLVEHHLLPLLETPA